MVEKERASYTGRRKHLVSGRNAGPDEVPAVDHKEGKIVVDFTSDDLCDALVIDPEGNEIGTLVRIYVHPVHRSPQWASVRTGILGSAKSFVPLDGAQWDGVHLRVAINKFLIIKAPHLDNQDDDELTETDTDSLDEYYAISNGTDRCEAAGLRDDAPTHHARAPDPTVAREINAPIAGFAE